MVMVAYRLTQPENLPFERYFAAMGPEAMPKVRNVLNLPNKHDQWSNTAYTGETTDMRIDKNSINAAATDH